VTGTARTTRLQLGRGGSPARVSIDVDSDYDFEMERGVLKPGNVHVGKTVGPLASGTLDTDVTITGPLDERRYRDPDREGRPACRR